MRAIRNERKEPAKRHPDRVEVQVLFGAINIVLFGRFRQTRYTDAMWQHCRVILSRATHAFNPIAIRVNSIFIIDSRYIDSFTLLDRKNVQCTYCVDRKHNGIKFIALEMQTQTHAHTERDIDDANFYCCSHPRSGATDAINVKQLLHGRSSIEYFLYLRCVFCVGSNESPMPNNWLTFDTCETSHAHCPCLVRTISGKIGFVYICFYPFSWFFAIFSRR